LKLAKKLGRELGEYLAEAELSLNDSLEAFLLHRTPVVNIIIDFTKGGGTLTRGVVEVIPLVNQLLDEILLSLVAAYQDYKNK